MQLPSSRYAGQSQSLPEILHSRSQVDHIIRINDLAALSPRQIVQIVKVRPILKTCSVDVSHQEADMADALYLR